MWFNASIGLVSERGIARRSRFPFKDRTSLSRRSYSLIEPVNGDILEP
jgi:hypothetical protein